MSELDEAAIFNRARRIAAPNERLEYLHQACHENQDAYDRLVVMLRVYEDDRDFLEAPPVELMSARDRDVDYREGTVIGRYKLLEQIGEGGFAVVYAAEQIVPVRR